MLILSRRPGESIMLGDDIMITVLRNNGYYGTQARLGITAPNNISVHRREIYDIIKKEEELAKLQALECL